MNATVLVTRPDAQELCREIEGLGYATIHFPTLDISAASDTQAIKSALQKKFDYYVFVSANAVRYAQPYLSKPEIYKQTKFVSIGPTTQKSLTQLNLPTDICPQDKYNSESLLALPEFENLIDKRIAIFCAPDGRKLLAQSFKKRGARVQEIFVYERNLPQADIASVIEQWHSPGIDVVVSTSMQSLQNLWKLLKVDGQKLLSKTPLIVISERMIEYAKQINCCPVLAENATTVSLISALKKLTIGKSND